MPLLPKQNSLSILETEIVLLQGGGENQPQKGTAQRFFRDSFLIRCSIIICLQNLQVEKLWNSIFLLLLFLTQWNGQHPNADFSSDVYKWGKYFSCFIAALCYVYAGKNTVFELTRKENGVDHFYTVIGKKLLLFLN